MNAMSIGNWALEISYSPSSPLKRGSPRSYEGWGVLFSHLYSCPTLRSGLRPKRRSCILASQTANHGVCR